MDMIDRLSKWLGRCGSYLYLICVITTGYEIVMRYFFNAPTSWAFEVTMMLCATAWLISGCYVAQQHGHIRITTIYDMVPEKTRRILDIFGFMAGIVALCGLAWAAYGPAVEAVVLMERTGSAFDSPMPAIIKPLIVIGALLYALQLLAQLVRCLRGEAQHKGGHHGR